MNYRENRTTQNNLYDPLSSVGADVELSFEKHDRRIEIVSLTENEYNEIHNKDPNTVYIIIDTFKAYQGDVFINDGEEICKCEYVLSAPMVNPNNHRYVVSVILYNKKIELASYNNKTDALIELEMRTKSISLHKLNSIRDAVHDYINSSYKKYEFVFRIMHIYNFQSPEFDRFKSNIRKYPNYQPNLRRPSSFSQEVFDVIHELILNREWERSDKLSELSIRDLYDKLNKIDW